MTIQKNKHKKHTYTGLPGSPAVKSPPSKEGGGTRIPHATGQLGPQVTTTEPNRSGAHALQPSPRQQGEIPLCKAQRHQLRPNVLKN